MLELRGMVPELRLLSIDRSFLEPRHALITKLREQLVNDAAAPGGAYSVDFLAAMMQTGVVFLRDRLLELPSRPPVLMDSYYYKILAKCRLAGLSDHPMFGWWRAFPRPRGVILLDTPVAEAWRRSAADRAPNPLEYHGDRPDRAAFVAYQEDLRRLLLEEVGGLPLRMVTEHVDPRSTAEAVRKELLSLDDR
ncbi:hypothetical protein [Frankia torreyi]|nr:hypothetical protein [Frankia torreyi]